MKKNQFESLSKHSLIAVAAASLLLVGCGASDGKESFSDRFAKRFMGAKESEVAPPAWKAETEKYKKAKESEAAEGEKGKEAEKTAAAPEPAKPSPIEATIQATEEIVADVGEKASEVTENIKTEVNEGINSLAAIATPSEAAPEEDLDVAIKPTPDIIRQVQQALADAGYKPGPVDGKSGGKTTEAIKQFQKDHNLAVGQITKETLIALGIAY